MRLRKDGYGGGVSEVRLGPEPIRRKVDQSGSHPLKPIRPSTAHLKLHPSEASVAAEMRSSDVDWYLQVLVEGTEDFRGVYRPGLLDSSADKFVTDPTELLFNDGLGQLQNTDLIQEGDDYRGRRSIIYWVCRCLSFLPSFLQMEVAVASSWYTPAMSSPQPLAQEVVSQSRWVEDGDSLSAWEVLENLVGEKLAFLTQAETQWRLHQRSFYKDDSSFEHEVYELQGVTPATLSPNLLRTETHDPSQSLSEEYTDRLKGGRGGERGSRGEVVVTYEHRSIDNMLPAIYTEEEEWEQDFVHAPGNQSTGQTSVLSGLPDEPNDDSRTVKQILSEDEGATIDPPYETHKRPIRLDDDGSALILKVKGVVFVDDGSVIEEAHTSLSYAEVVLEADDGTTYRLRRQVSADGDSFAYDDPSWVTSSDGMVAFKMDIPEGNDRSENERTVNEESVEAPPLPDAGTVEVRLWGFIVAQPDKIDGGATSSDFNEIYYIVDEAVLKRLKGDREERETTASTPDIDADQDALTRSVLHGTGPSSAHPAATFVGGEPAQDWAIGIGHGSGVPADELLAREALQQVASRLGVHKWEVHPTLPHMTGALSVRGSTFLPVHLVRRYKRGTTEAEWVEVVDAGVTESVSVEIGDEGSGGSSDGSSGGGGTGGAAVGWADVKRKPPGILSRSGEGGTLTPQSAVSSFRPGPVPQDSEVFSRLFISGFGVRGLTLFAGAAPAADYRFSVRLNGAEQATVTLSAGANSAEKPFSFSTTGGDRLSVVGADPRDNDLSDVHATFDISL